MMSTEANKALVRRYFEDLANHADLSVAADSVTPEYVANVQHLTRMLHTAFPDFHVIIEQQIAEGNLVATGSMGCFTCRFRAYLASTRASAPRAIRSFSCRRSNCSLFARIGIL